jgi:lipopolysaccharide export system protein LptA
MLALLPLITAVRAQDFGAAFSDFDTGSDNPIQIEADRLEVRDSEKLAIYSGHVRVRQGETILEAPELRIYYARPEGAPASAPGAAGALGSAVSRIEAGPGVTVRSGDRTASGDRAILDMANDLVTLEGNAILTQGSSVVRGDRVIVNLATKQGRVEGGRVQTLITPSGAAGVP